MEIRILLYFFFTILLITNDVNARKFGSSRGLSHSLGHSGVSRAGSYSSTGHTRVGSNSFRHGTSSGGDAIGLNPFRNSPNRHTTGSNLFVHKTTSSQTLQNKAQQNKDSSTSLLHAEGRRLPEIYPGSQAGKTSVMTKQNSASYKPSAPPNPSAPYNPLAPYSPSIVHPSPHSQSVSPANHLSKSTMISSQNHAPTSSGQSSASSRPLWANPHFNPNQPHPSVPTFSNIGFKDHLRPQQGVSHPRPPYPVSNFNSPSHSISHTSQPHFMHNQAIGHPSNYPAHVPPPIPGTFGNPYSTHPTGTAYGPAGYGYPQQHILTQPAAQPYIPGQTIITVPAQQDSGRGFGQMVKEALVFSTINAGVNRLLNPHHHYIPDSRLAGNSGGTTSETHITYNNHYFNNAPPGYSPPVPASAQGNIPSTYPANYPSPVNNPIITPGVSTPIIVGNNGSTIYPNTFSNNSFVSNDTNGPPVAYPNGTANAMNKQETFNQGTVYSPQYKISDNDLWILTEELFAKQEINAYKYLTLYLQNKSQNVSDAAMKPLIHVQQDAYNYPTILAIRALYDNYEHNSTVKEKHTPEKQKKQDLLLEVFLHTNVMSRAMQWLSDRGFINPDDFERKETLRHIWFSQFDGTTSGFERVFTSEIYSQDLLGVQDWIYFDYQESKKRIDYMGYVDMLKLGDDPLLLKLNFKMDDIIRPNATIFIGTLPELEMSLYTICFYARPNDLCPISLGGVKFNIFTHSFRYYGKDLIDLALPIF